MDAARVAELPGDRAGRKLALIGWCVVVLALATAPVAAQPGLQIADISVGGEGAVDTRNGVVYLWQSAPHSIEVTVETGTARGEGHYVVCLSTTRLEDGAKRELECRETVLSGNSTASVTFRGEAWPEPFTGRQTVTAVVSAGTLSRDEVANASVPFHVLRTGEDPDGDGLTNQEEAAAGTNFTAADTDGDGLRDGLERTTYGTDPNSPDTDGDGLEDGPEVSETETDPTTADTDGDGLADAEEVRELGTDPTRPDTDGDGLADSSEVNTYGTDPNSPDTDGDGLDDRAEVNDHDTEPTAPDTDGDGLGDALEVHTYGTNPRKADTDADGLDDGREVYDARTDPTVADTDGDGLKDGPEMNAHGTNPNRADTDGDGLEDGAEVGRYETDPTLADTDSDGVDDAREVGQGSTPLPGWGWPALAALGLVVAGGLALLRRDGFPVTPETFGLGREPEAVPGEGTPDGGVARDVGGRADAELEVPLPNQELVLAILQEHGGRMRQSAVVEQTDWSKAKVSRVLQRMDEEDQVTKINVGRENIVTLPGHEPEQSRPPFEAND